MSRRILYAFTGVMLAAFVAIISGCRTPDAASRAEVWRGVHVPVFSGDELANLQTNLPKLAALGVNVLIVEVDYHFDFQSHPELRESPSITRTEARDFADAARKLGIRVIPELDCLGHQSWSSHTSPLLVKYPQFDETPGQFSGNKGIYCRSWCPQSPGLNGVVNALIDELVDAFQADAFHVGMDEVFLIADEHCPRCHGKDPAELFAKAVNALHRHIVGERNLTMLMWGDRMLDAQTMGYGRWESAANGTARAVDLVPKDIVLCDWHYLAQTNYPSVPFLLNKGFRVWPSGFEPLDATKTFSQFALEKWRADPRVVGYLCTTWGKAKVADLATWPPITEILPEWKSLK